MVEMSGEIILAELYDAGYAYVCRDVLRNEHIISIVVNEKKLFLVQCRSIRPILNYHGELCGFKIIHVDNRVEQTAYNGRYFVLYGNEQ